MESEDKGTGDLKGDTMHRSTDSANVATVKVSEKAKPCYHCNRRHDPKICKFKDAKWVLFPLPTGDGLVALQAGGM